MKAEWTSVTPSVSKVTLGDDANKHAIVLESLGADSQEQVVPLARAANPLRFPRGNAAGEVAFTATKTHASRDAAASYAAGEIARLNQQGTLELTFDTHKLTCASATLKGVRAVSVEGLRWTIRYTFGVTTITYA
jgi:hypothetical protein